MKIQIDRLRWLRGEGATSSKLLRKSDQKMCCLGFLALACGAKPSDIEDRATPCIAKDVLWPEGIFNRTYKETGEYAYRLMWVNDAEGRKDSEREDLVKEYMDYCGIEVEFIN